MKMRQMRPSSFRSRVLFILFMTMLASTFITAAAIGSIRILSLGKQIRETAQVNSDSYLMYTEELLSSVEKEVRIIAVASNQLSRAETQELIETALQGHPLVQSIFVLDAKGIALSIAQDYAPQDRVKELIGNDFSTMWLLGALKESETPSWSNRYVSPLAMDTEEEVIAAACSYGSRRVIAELSIPNFIDELKRTKRQFMANTWVTDKNGMIIADTEAGSNPDKARVPIISVAEAYRNNSGEIPKILFVDNKSYFIGGAVSEKLHWVFVTRIPANLRNPLLKAVFVDLIFMAGISAAVFTGFILVLIRRITKSMDVLIDRARLIARGGVDIDWTPDKVSEFNELALVLKTMAEAVQTREQKLKSLNENLEQLVHERTRELSRRNTELADTMEELSRTRDELTRSENLASLGRLVAGVAHELNEPLGNGIKALCNLEDSENQFERNIEQKLSRTDLDEYLNDFKSNLAAAHRNLEKAANLVSSFRQVANDQASNQRRIFSLEQMLKELMLTLQPSLKGTPHSVFTEFEQGIAMDSYPGVLGQIVTNLINNALLHAWNEGEKGEISVTTKKSGDLVRIMVSDDGHGIPKDIQSKIFEPFFTTKQGKGGTGLGLKIAQNDAENVLGGSLYFYSSEGEGTRFLLEVPVTAPFIESEPDGG